MNVGHHLGPKNDENMSKDTEDSLKRLPMAKSGSI